MGVLGGAKHHELAPRGLIKAVRKVHPKRDVHIRRCILIGEIQDRLKGFRKAVVGVGRPVRLKVGHLPMGDREPWVFEQPAQVVAVHKRIGVVDPAPTLHVQLHHCGCAHAWSALGALIDVCTSVPQSL